MKTRFCTFQKSAAVAMSGALLLAITGCSPQETAAKASAASAQATVKRTAWDWEKYPPVTRMRLGTLPCQLQPKSSITVHSPFMGTLRLYVDTPQSELEEGFLWGEFEPEIFAAEEKALTEGLRRLNDREKVQWEIELPRKRLQMERALEEAQRQAAYQRLLSTNQEMADLVLNFGAIGGPLRPDALEKTELELNLLEQTMDFIQETNLTALGFDLGAQRLDWERRNLEFKKRKDQSQFRMPFSGMLTLSLPVTANVTEYPVTSGQELGVIRDFSSIRLRVPIANASWSSIPGEKLTATVRMPTGEGLQAQFAFQKIERIQNREESVYYFQFPPNRSGTAARLVGSHVACELSVRLEEPVRVVPKLSLVLHDLEAFENRSWAIAVSTLFPGARLVAEGQTDVAIAVPQSITVSQVAR